MLSYLDALDAAVNLGAARFGGAFRATQTQCLTDLQRPDGGFPGRLGDADTYYTEFALRTLVLVEPDSPALCAAAGFMRSAGAPADIVRCFSALSARRLLARAGLTAEPELEAAHQVLALQRLDSGGYTRPGGSEASAYETFLAGLCLELMGETYPDPIGCARAMDALRAEDGGFREQAGDGSAQTSATGAALGALALAGMLEAEVGTAALEWMGRMQAADGGFLAHPQAPCGDLLSTFTVLATLALLGDLRSVGLTAAAGFIKAMALPEGGFRACAVDDGTDTEYAFYGVGALALLRSAAVLGG